MCCGPTTPCNSPLPLDFAEDGMKEVTTILAQCRTRLEVPAEIDEKPIDMGELTLTPPEPVHVDR